MLAVPSGGGLLARGITAFSTTAVSKAKKARLAVANCLVVLSEFGSSAVALMNSAFEEASTIKAWMASTSKSGLGG